MFKVVFCTMKQTIHLKDSLHLHFSALVDTMTKEIHSSRRVLVVVTPGLLETPLALWCIEQSLCGVLKRNLKAVAIVLKVSKCSTPINKLLLRI